MYQIKYSAGYEIRVIGKGENGLCRVYKATSGEDTEKSSGTYAECETWLRNRNIFATTAGDQANRAARGEVRDICSHEWHRGLVVNGVEIEDCQLCGARRPA